MNTDPAFHRQLEGQLIDHVDRLLDDDRLRLDTVNGRRPVPLLGRRIVKEDRELELKRLMSELNKPDRDLQNRMPVGQSLSVTLWRTKMFFFKQNVGRLRVACLSPTRELLGGGEPKPMGTQQLRSAITTLAAAGEGFPTTLVILSTAGFTTEAHELAERNANRTVILVEPNDGGGWTVTGPAETKALVDLFDPEGEDGKRQRVREAIEESKGDLIDGSLAADRLASRLHLPLQVVEAEVKGYARENSGLTAKRLDGRLVLYREGAAAPRIGGSDMPFLQRMKSLFSRKGDTEKKVALLSERKATLSQQRDASHDELEALEQKESDLRTQFKETDSASARRRITSQLVQLRKDMERRQQLRGMLDQQINVISTHLHNLTLVQQGQAAKLPSPDELASDAAAAEATMAELQADYELAGSVTSTTPTGLSDEEQELYDELEREAGEEKQEAVAESPAAQSTRTPPAREAVAPPPLPPVVAPPRKQRGEAEPG